MRSVKTGTEEAIQRGDEAAHTSAGDTHHPLNHAGSHQTTASGLSFIESQFPVSRLSKESYKERKANYSQTLTGLGKWWGRKPLIMVRAIILGLLMPASDEPHARTERYSWPSSPWTMRDFWRRKRQNLPLKEDLPKRLSRRERAEVVHALDTDPNRPRMKGENESGGSKERLQRLVFDRLKLRREAGVV